MECSNMDFYVSNAFFSTLFILAIVLPIYFIRQRRKYKTIPDERSRFTKISSILLIVYVSALIAVLVFPYWMFELYPSLGVFDFHFVISTEREVNLIPFKTLIEQITAAVKQEFATNYELSFFNILINLGMFAPMPILLKLVNKKIPLPMGVLVSFVFSLVCEFLQYFVGRSSDIDDLILNTLGSVIGCGVYLIGENAVKKYMDKKKAKAS